MKLLQKGILLILVPLICELAFVAILFGLHRDAEAETRRHDRSREILFNTDSIMVSVYDLTWQTMSNLSIGVASPEKVDELVKRVSGHIKTLKELASDNATQLKNVQRFESSIQEIISIERMICSSRDEDGLETPFMGPTQLKPAIKKFTTEIGRIKRDIHAEESKAGAPDAQRSTARDRESKAVAGFVILNIILCLGLAIFFFKDVVLRISNILNNSKRFSRGEALSAPLHGKDEIADLDRAFHEMAEAVAAASRRERALIENAVDIICSINEFGIFTAVSQASLESWGYEPEELIGKNIGSILTEECASQMFTTFTDIRHTGKTVFALENKIATKDGAIKDMLWSAQWSHQDRSFFCTVHDNSERKAMERMKQDFINMISHDLKTPLTAVRLTLELVLKGVYGQLDKKGENRILVAQNSTQRLLELVGQLLLLEKLEDGMLELQKTECQILSLLDTAVQSVQPFAEEHKVRLDARCDADLLVLVDPDRLVQVLINLISNAVKFSPAGGSVIVSAETIASDLLVKVKDQGRGVPEHLKISIFERFKQVERGDAEQKGGTGLGLSICQAIVAAHQGEIGVDSEPGQGSTFWFRLPDSVLKESSIAAP